MTNIIEFEIEILDVWGEGRIDYPIGEGRHITGFHTAYNLNHVDKKIGAGPNTDKNIPKLIPIDDYDNPKFPIADGKCQYITSMSSPFYIPTAIESLRVFNKTPGYGAIYLYGLRDEFIIPVKNLYIGIKIEYNSKEYFLNHRRFKTPESLPSPFNEIKDSPNYVDIFFFHRGSLPREEL
ncbi:hypothetical protein KKI93_21255 [Xenorhabdus bovienii]|uniref:Uncharacterized protein n=1 Tax=Xenorhabdus bovienii str. Intermedium TaxID=1379677 RepID=A0A077QRP2_XENBV|nr:hypothetical protein [Xenorhabdus bovienii]MDE9545517.1 hypothetical protein [Xenorhabdus bovienii]MDE9566488.1 hypothetical protein [Xenorhabdus bovienii]CDH35221.1 hypothetical protein XBI1_880001 [Xenorhabdus bovienii str. Intermedium]